MAALILDGRALAGQWEQQLSERVATLKQRAGGRVPILATILVGDDPASATYVRMKGDACRRVGMESLAVDLPAATTTEQLLGRIRLHHSDPYVPVIALLTPAPDHIAV